jgi:hypothetical protein
MAHTLSFERDYDTGPHRAIYQAALTQLRLSIKQGGFGLTSQELVAPAALFVATRDFHQWLAGTAFDLPWLPGGSGPHDQLPSTEALKQEALVKLQHSLGCTNSLQNLSQNTIAEELKAMILKTLAKSISSLPGSNHRLLAITGHTQPGTGSSSDIKQGPGLSETNHYHHSSTSLFALLCPLELSNAAFVTSAALILGTPVPHAQYLRNQSPSYAQIDVFGDRLLNDATHAAHSRTQSHDYIAKFLADLATQYGIPTSVKNVPFANSNSQRRADLVTCRGGLVRPNPRLNFDQGTLLVMDFELGHTFDSSHSFKLNNLANMENQKRAKYLADYHDQGLAFAPLVCNSLGQLGPDFQNFLWALADHAAKNQFSANLLDKQCVDFPTADQATFQKLRSFLYLQALDKILAAIFEGVTERIYGRTFALRSLPAYQHTVAERSQPWYPSNSAPPAVLVSSNATASSPVANGTQLQIEPPRLQPCSGSSISCHHGSSPVTLVMDCS